MGKYFVLLFFVLATPAMVLAAHLLWTATKVAFTKVIAALFVGWLAPLAALLCAAWWTVIVRGDRVDGLISLIQSPARNLAVIFYIVGLIAGHLVWRFVLKSRLKKEE